MIVSTVDPQLLVQNLSKEKVVLMPLAEYQSLLDRLEELQDIQTMLQAEAEYQTGQGRPFREFLAEHQDAFDL